jgi:hypothetical protein
MSVGVGDEGALVVVRAVLVGSGAGAGAGVLGVVGMRVTEDSEGMSS